MDFNFSGVKANLDGINKYLESNGIKLSGDDVKQLESIFIQADKSVHKDGEQGYNDGELDIIEQMNFKQKILSVLPKIKEKVGEFFSGVNKDTIINKPLESYLEAKTDAISNGNVRNQPQKIIIKKADATKPVKTVDLIKNVIDYKKITLSDADIKYWSNLVDKVAKKYNVSPALLITIISKECGFEKHSSNSNGAGPMGITTIAIQSFLPKTSNGKQNGWAKIYKDMHPELVDDILQHSSSANKLRQDAGKNDELGILLGLLTYEMKYCSEVARKKYGKADYITIPKAIKEVKEGYRLDKKSDEQYLKSAFKNYNGSSIKEKYSIEAMDSLKRLTKGNYENLIFRVPSK